MGAATTCRAWRMRCCYCDLARQWCLPNAGSLQRVNDNRCNRITSVVMLHLAVHLRHDDMMRLQVQGHSWCQQPAAACLTGHVQLGCPQEAVHLRQALMSTRAPPCSSSAGWPRLHRQAQQHCVCFRCLQQPRDHACCRDWRPSSPTRLRSNTVALQQPVGQACCPFCCQM